MSLYTETVDKGASLSDLLIFEINTEYSREAITLTSSDAVMPMGTVLAQGSSGAYAPFTGAEGQTASAVLVKTVPAKATNAVALVRGAVLNGEALEWGSTSEANKTLGLASLKTATVIVRS